MRTFFAAVPVPPNEPINCGKPVVPLPVVVVPTPTPSGLVTGLLDDVGHLLRRLV